VKCFAEWTELARAKIERVPITFNGCISTLLLQRAGSGAPVVVLFGGLDSSKECELHYFARHFFEREMTVAYADLPGQGELFGHLSVLDHFDEYVPALIARTYDVLPDAGRLGVFGVSLGGYLALRAAAGANAIRAVASLGGFFDHAPFRNLGVDAREALVRAFTLDVPADLESLGRDVSLDRFAAGPKCPMLIVHAERDHLVAEEQIHKIQKWASGSSVVALPGAEHVGTTQFPTVLPRIADWMKSALSNEAN
jgi:2,6-dihydroxypseudooxynicotine hydrolase